MSDPSLALQKAVVATLRAVVGAAVYDQAAPNVFPRITIGEGQVLGDYADCYDGSDTSFDVHIWSRAVGFPEAKTIASQVRDALNDQMLSLDGHTVGFLRFTQSQMLRDPDGLTSHIAMTFRALTQPSD